MNDLVPTVVENRNGVPVVINATDFDPATMVRWEEPAPEPAQVVELGNADRPQRGRPRKVVDNDA